MQNGLKLQFRYCRLVLVAKDNNSSMISSTNLDYGKNARRNGNTKVY